MQYNRDMWELQETIFVEGSVESYIYWNYPFLQFICYDVCWC